MRSGTIFLLMLMLASGAVAFAAEPHGGEGAAAAGEGSPSVFTGHWAESLWAVVSFCVLLLARWKLAWKRLLAALQARQEHIQGQVDEAGKIRKDAEEVLSQYRGKLSDADTEGKAIIEQHVRDAQKQSAELIAGSREDIEAMRLRLETDIERARRVAQKELLAQSGQIILNLGREILGRNINAEDNQKFIDDAIERLEQENQRDDEQGGGAEQGESDKV